MNPVNARPQVICSDHEDDHEDNETENFIRVENVRYEKDGYNDFCKKTNSMFRNIFKDDLSEEKYRMLNKELEKIFFLTNTYNREVFQELIFDPVFLCKIRDEQGDPINWIRLFVSILREQRDSAFLMISDIFNKGLKPE